MEKKFTEYLYYRGEEDNPFRTDDERKLRKDVFWHYEKIHCNVKGLDPNLSSAKDYIKNIMNHSLDENDPTGKHYRMYLNNGIK